MSDWCKDDVCTGDMQGMSLVMLVKLGTGFYSARDRATEVYPGWMKDRINRRLAWSVAISEVMSYGCYGRSILVGLERFVGKNVGNHGKLFGKISFQDRHGIAMVCNKQEE